MHHKRNQIHPHVDSSRISQGSDSPTIVRTDANEQKQTRRRSLDNLLGNMIARDERTHEEVVRENLRQVIIKHHDWDTYLTNDPDYVAFIRNWSSCWRCSYSLCPNHTERHYLESLDEHFQCALHYAVRYNNLRVCQSLILKKKCGNQPSLSKYRAFYFVFSMRYQCSRNQWRNCFTYVCKSTNMVQNR